MLRRRASEVNNGVGSRHAASAVSRVWFYLWKLWWKGLYEEYIVRAPNATPSEKNDCVTASYHTYISKFIIHGHLGWKKGDEKGFWVALHAAAAVRFCARVRISNGKSAPHCFCV
jgi:hypothetical protein